MFRCVIGQVLVVKLQLLQEDFLFFLIMQRNKACFVYSKQQLHTHCKIFSFFSSCDNNNDNNIQHFFTSGDLLQALRPFAELGVAS